MEPIEALMWAIVGAVISLFFAVLFQNPLNRMMRRVGHRAIDNAVGRKLSSAATRERRHRDFLSRDFEKDGVFTLHRWSAERPLERDPRLHRLEYGEPPGQDWIAPDELRAAQIGQAKTRKGVNAYAFDMTVDHREHLDADKFILRVAKSNHGDLNAIGDCIGATEMIEFVRQRLHEKGTIEFLRTMPPTRLSLQVSIVSKQGRVLAIRRSHTVTSVPGMWTLGPNETLVPAPPGRSPGSGEETLFDLAERCLAEECGLFVSLSRPEIGPIHFTWFGLSVNPPVGVAQNMIALTTCNLDESEITERITNAHSNYEADGIDWLQFSLDGMRGAVLDPSRRWVNFSRLACVELWRWRRLLQDDLDSLAVR